MIKPISPDEAKQAKILNLPDEVLEIVNSMLAKEYTGTGSVTIYQNAVISAIEAKMGCDRKTIFANHYLDFEPHYRAAGWSVDYDRPAYNESYEAFWKFSKK